MKLQKDIQTEIGKLLKSKADQGKQWVAYEECMPITSADQLHTFSDRFDAAQFAHDNTSDYDRMTYQYIPDIINQLNNKAMNTQNVEFLQSQLKNFGFGETLNKDLASGIQKGLKEFQLQTEIPHFNNRMDYTLHLRKSDTTDMYFINRYDASLKHSDASLDKSQTFYVNNGSSITAKEAFNLLEGRAVHKELKTQEQVKYKAWIKLDFDTKTDSGNHKIKQFGEKYGYDLEKALDGFTIKELADPNQKVDLMRSLERGNVQSVTVVRDGGKEARYFIEASPQYKNVNVYDHKMNPVKRDTIKEVKKSESVSQGQEPKASVDRKQNADQKEDPLVQNKRSKKKGVKV
ncbi:hypothetical protein [Daejeonella sp. JGW-45]|uniref:hypothetical protein n=1 Tax=Daejeonella sp. JGW-45 TaxID=3034148 RepID=UPI0023EDD726|nr:hypothetical protein [Daejeonella sp. JGW-45]